ncbi:MAG TPA: pseudouridine synthase [Petrotogaceae bacterium]|nr:pseudouridine synthase [Petrotogaceae bacterium]
MRLDKFICDSLSISRSECKKAISGKKVKINGTVVTSADYKVEPCDVVMFMEKVVSAWEDVYIVLYKPRNYICDRDSVRYPSVFSLIKEKTRKDLSVAGRLDADVHGLVILSTDGEIIHKIISPRKNVYKKYEARFSGSLTQQSLEMLRNGVKFDDFTSKPALVTVLSDNLMQIEISEGKYHQVKRMMAAAGLSLLDLKRTAIGAITLGKLLPGEYEYITKQEIYDKLLYK